MNIFQKPALTIVLAIIIVPAAGIAWVASQDDAATLPSPDAQAHTSAMASPLTTDGRPLVRGRRSPGVKASASVPQEEQRAIFQNSGSDRIAANRAKADDPRADVTARPQMTSGTRRSDSSSTSSSAGSTSQESSGLNEPEKMSPQAFAGPASPDSMGCVERGELRVDPNTGQTWPKVWQCNNDKHSPLYIGANNSTLVAYVESTSTEIVCYRQGEEHQGGNNIWYYTQGDLWVAASAGRSGWGYMPAANVGTGTDPFPGIPLCTPDMWQARLHVTDPNTGKSWSTIWFGVNSNNAPLYKNANATDVTGFMETTTSWFVCYARGAAHDGGNNVWYYSQGDRATPGWASRRAWGFMPAQYLSNRQNPYDGVPLCDF